MLSSPPHENIEIEVSIMRIKITENGPYMVTGGIPIKEMIITQKGQHLEFKEGRILPQSETYALCRCGHSKNAPFCDGAHISTRFDGTETASRVPYRERITDVTFGSTIRLLDDGRCAFARFCHTDHGDIWSLTEQDANPEFRKEAIQATHNCPAGRLVAVDRYGTEIEKQSDPEIIIMQDPLKNASAAIYVKGPIVVEAVDGTEYEIRNRVALCRCGKSSNKPFCDASHVQYAFDDGHTT